MFELKVENGYGEKLKLTSNPSYTVTKIEGLCPAGATIHTSPVATNDGTMFNSSKVNERNLVITIVINEDVERNRISLYKYIKPKHPVKIYYKHSLRDVMIEGYVETLECDLFEQGQQAQISILCPQPYFKDVDKLVTMFSSTKPVFEFPFAIASGGVEFSTLELLTKRNVINRGDVASGINIELFATGVVINPTVYNLTTRETFKLKATMQVADLILINTNVGEKSLTLIRAGKEINIINALDKNSNWVRVQSGDNIFTYECDAGVENLQVKITHTDKYEGV